MTARFRLLSVRRVTLFAGMAATLAGFAWLLSAQDATPPGFRAYRLQHAQTGDIVPQLENMLSGEGSHFEIAVDRSGNRILVQGDDAAQRLAAQLIEAMDQAPAKPPAPRASGAPAVVRSYQVEPGQLDRALDELRKNFPPATGTRIAGDPRTSQLLVVAAEETQNRIAQALQSSGSPAKPSSPSPAETSRGARLQHVSARELENSLVRLLGGRLTRATTSDGQMTVFSVASATGLQPVLQVNRQHDSVSYLGTADSAQVWQRVVQALDRSPVAVEQQTDLVQLDRADPQKVQRAVILMQTGAYAADGPAARLASTVASEAPATPAAQAPAPAAPPPAAGEQTPAANAPQAEEGITAQDEGGLIGPVQIEYIQGLDAMVIRGHKRDVERVKKIIADIESSSIETEPLVEIVQLKNVGCQVLATLLTTVYNDILSPRQGKVNMQALVKPNALLLIGRPESVKTVMSLIEKLDQPSKPESQFEVFALKHISAANAETTILSFYIDRLGQTQQGQTGQQQQRPGLGTRINAVAVTDYRINLLVVQAGPTDMEEVRRLIAQIDIPEAEFEVFSLKFISANDAQTTIQTLYADRLSGAQSGGTQAGQGQQRAQVGQMQLGGAQAGQGAQRGGLGTPINVVAVPDYRSNAIVVQASPTDMTAIRRLIAEIDIPETKFEVFRLKHVSATDAQATIQNFFVGRVGQTQQQTQQQGVQAFQAIQGQQSRGLGTRVNIVADYRTNAIIVQAAAPDMEQVRQLIAQIDIDTTAAANELRIFRLKNSLASDLGPVLQDALNWQLVGSRAPLGATRTGTIGGGQTFGQQEERARIRSAILSFMTVDAKGGKVLESGLLADVRVTVDTNSNSLVVTAPAKSMGLIEALINELDRLPNASAQIKVFTIVNGDATRLSTMLTQLLGQQTTTQTTTGTLFGQGALSPFLASGMQSAAASGESTLVPVRFGVDQRTNSIIATGSEGDLGVVEAILMRLDEQSLLEHKTMVYWLANVPAENVAEALSEWIQSRTTLFQQQLSISPESPDIQWNRRLIVVPETISNSIIISAAPELFDEVQHVVESLDRKPPLIKIDVLIAEVVLSKDFEFGAEWGLQDSLLFDRTYINSDTGADAGRPGFNFNNVPLGDTGGPESNVLGQSLTSFGLGRVSQLGYGGLVLAASSDAVSALLRALEEEGRAQVLSRPTVTTLDKQPAFINVGATVSRLAGTTQNVNTTTQDVEDVETGLIVGVTPQITPDGLIVMEVDAQKSKLSTTEFVELPTGGADGKTFRQYNIDKVQAQTTISARSGQTIVFAGLIQTDKANIERGVPFLSDIPVVGRLFQFVQESETRRELMIIMTPQVVNVDEDLDRIKLAESERMSWCLADVVSLYGDVGFSSRPGDWCGCLTDVPTIFPDANPTGAEPVPTPLPAGEGQMQPLPPAPSPASGRPAGILEPSPPPAGTAPAPEPVSHTGYQPWPPAMGYPGATLRYDGSGQTPQGPPLDPYQPGMPPAAGDPYTSARRLPQDP